MNEKQITAAFEREQARMYRLDTTEILWLAQQAGLLREDYVSAVDVVENIIAELMRTRAELEQARGAYEQGYADGAASALVEAPREMEW